MTEQPAATDRQTLTPESAAALRRYAADERAKADRLTEALEDLAVNGLPRAEDCTPWETIRDRRLAQLAAQRSHAA
ncbi:hypothetical protein GCM10009760_63090 [Kitasatospora kazusensis]|uniref:CopG family transcriptional regulator n=1 Tax=Kitasatospora kazusensis TaxID=407974 RepID=A0ABP4KGL7_9ACTN